MSECETCRLVARRDRVEAPAWDSILRTANWDGDQPEVSERERNDLAALLAECLGERAQLPDRFGQ